MRRYPYLLVPMLLLGGYAAWKIVPKLRGTPFVPGCTHYVVSPTSHLVAHAGGGTPKQSYANSLAAVEASYRRGHRYFEMDFVKLPLLPLRIGHEWGDALWPPVKEVQPLLRWLAKHPDTYLITDVKTGNVGALTELARWAGPLRARIIPQIYQPSELASVSRLGFHKPIFTIYRNRDPNWIAFANSADLFAVTIPVEKAALAPRIRKPVYVHTVNEPRIPRNVAGLYTDCLIPRSIANGVGEPEIRPVERAHGTPGA